MFAALFHSSWARRKRKHGVILIISGNYNKRAQMKLHNILYLTSLKIKIVLRVSFEYCSICAADKKPLK